MKVLFIGNSHTYYNDMTRMFSDLANANGHAVEVDTVTRGGWILHDYLDVENEHSQKLDRLSKEGNFDLCFLQEQALTPVKDYAMFADGVKRICDKLAGRVGKFMLYETFGWHDDFYRMAEYGLTWCGMAEATTKAYQKLSEELGIAVSYAGSNFCRVRRERPELPMFRDDGVHATYEGSCLIALTHYYSVFGELPRDTSALELPEELRAYFLQIVGDTYGK